MSQPIDLQSISSWHAFNEMAFCLLATSLLVLIEQVSLRLPEMTSVPRLLTACRVKDTPPDAANKDTPTYSMSKPRLLTLLLE